MMSIDKDTHLHTCSACEGVFYTEETFEELFKKYIAEFPNAKPEGLRMVCNECAGPIKADPQKSHKNFLFFCMGCNKAQFKKTE